MNNVRLIKPAATTTHAPRVLTADFQERLAALNSAERELRGMGLQVVWTHLTGPKPQIHILRDVSVSIRPLLDRMGGRAYASKPDHTLVSGDFAGVIVSWCEPRQ